MLQLLLSFAIWCRLDKCGWSLACKAPAALTDLLNKEYVCNVIASFAVGSLRNTNLSNPPLLKQKWLCCSSPCTDWLEHLKAILTLLKI